ncbi:MAG TPA: CvpA family protein [Stellaceae bacterium]|nr:CvpA family protein [Stellaceae bacterium]
MNPVDIFVIAVILLSGLFAFASGFIKEVLWVGAWVGAGIATYFGFTWALPIAERFLPKGIFSMLAAGAAVFVVALIVLSIVVSAVGAAVTKRLKEIGLTAIDRTLGLLFGLARGFIIACFLYLLVVSAMSEADRPQWIKEARSTPMLEIGATTLSNLIPVTLRSRVESIATDAARKIDQDRQADGASRALQTPKPVDPGGTGGNKGGADSRRDMNRLFQQNNQ